MVLRHLRGIGMKEKIPAILGLTLIGIAGRLVPHVPNATPITAITIAARKHVGAIWSFLIPLAAMALSDLVIGFYNWKILLSVYASFMLIAAISKIAKKCTSPISAVVLAAMSSVLFFLITNFVVWAFSPWYAKSIWGLLYCYELGLPFLRSMLLGDIAYTALVLGAFEFARTKVPVRGLAITLRA